MRDGPIPDPPPAKIADLGPAFDSDRRGACMRDGPIPDPPPGKIAAGRMLAKGWGDVRSTVGPAALPGGSLNARLAAPMER